MSPESEPAPETDAQDGPTFSAASMFGVLLTLSLCLLVQPQGSLLSRRPSGAYGRVCFFFWRLNPIACALEAAVGLHALALTLRRAVKSCNGNLYNEFAVFTVNLQTGAAGLLLLRGHTALHLWDTDARLNERLIRPAPRRGRTEMVIDFVALLPVSVTIVKLAASTVPWHFQVISWCYISGWIVVQLAVMISNYCPQKEQPDLARLLQSVGHLQGKADALGLCSSTCWLVMAIVFPLSRLFFLIGPESLGYFVLQTFTVAATFLLQEEAQLPSQRQNSETPATVVSLIAFLTTTFALVMALLSYQEDGTFKPEWLDWLG